jgi:hypothetical protein
MTLPKMTIFGMRTAVDTVYSGAAHIDYTGGTWIPRRTKRMDQ